MHMNKGNTIVSKNATRDIYTPNCKGIRQLTCIFVGGGSRGKNYAAYSGDHPHLLKIVAIADPRHFIQKLFGVKYGVPEEMQFNDWNHLAEMEKFADFVCICLPDHLHKDASVAFANKGYSILLEKPMATTKKDCEAIIQCCKKNNVLLSVCYVLRYSSPYQKIEELINTGKIGDIIHINHHEPVGHMHFAHSFVRGNWRNEATSSFSLLTKCCHDIDLILNWMRNQNNGRSDNTPNRCKMVSTFGNLSHFKKENKPKDAGDRCLDCKIENECQFSAVKNYIHKAKSGNWYGHVSLVSDIEDIKALEDCLRKGPYGECVYNGHNNVCDHQVVNMEFEGGQTATMTMVALAEKIPGRKTSIFGSKGELTYNAGNVVSFYEFLSGTTTEYECTPTISTSLNNHADFYLFDAFVRALLFNDPTLINSNLGDTLQSHIVAFVAEESRKNKKVMFLRQ